MSGLGSILEKPIRAKFNGQESGEEIVFLLRRHWVTNLPWVFGSLVALVFPSLLFNFPEIFGIAFPSARVYFIFTLIWFLFVFGFVFERFLNWYFNVYVFTNKRIVDIDFWGMFYTEVSEAPLDKIQDVTYKMGGIFQVMFNYGDLFIQTAAEEQEFEFKAVPRPAYVHDKITDYVSLT